MSISSMFAEHARRQEAYFMANVRAEAMALYERGETIEKSTWDQLRMNSWERHLLLPLVSDEVLVEEMRYAMGNISMRPKSKFSPPALTYEEVLMTTYLPMLVHRFCEARFGNAAIPGCEVRNDAGVEGHAGRDAGVPHPARSRRLRRVYPESS